MRIRILLLLAVLGLAALGGPVRAGEDDPAARARQIAEGFPSPTAEHAFEFSCYVLRAGAPYGRLTLSARSDQIKGSFVWRVKDVIKPLRSDGDHVEMEAVLDRRLGCVSGRYHRRNAEGFLRASWERLEDGTGYRLEYTSTEYENRLVVTATEAGLTSLSGLLLFLRLAPARAATYVLPEFDPNPAGGDDVVMPARVDVHRIAPWRVAGGVEDAWVVSLTRGKQSSRLALAKDGRAFLGMSLLGTPFQFVPEGSGPVGLADPDQAGVAMPVEQARARTRALRARLPVPEAPFSFTGDLRLDDTIVGEVWLSAVPAAFDGQPAWEVTEARVTRTGEAEVVQELTSFIGHDLRLLRGEQRSRRPEGRRTSTFVRRGPAMETVHAVDGTRRDPLQAAAPAGAVTGLVPVLLFLRQAPLEPAQYVLPGWDPRWARPPKAGSGSFATDVADVYVDVRGASVLELGGRRRATWMALCSQRAGQVYEVHLDPRDRSLQAVVGRMPRLTIAPQGIAGRAVTWYDAVEGEPQSARQAFVKFGRGYHRPRPDLLADAFHWPTMRSVALRRGQYPEGTIEDEIRDGWIDVFVKMSKHRTAGDCDDLLFQMFMTSRETLNPDGSVSMATLPVYGGHTYRMQKLGDRWYIVQID